MSKRTRHGDNSKRQQPVQQQRAQARQPASGGPTKSSGGNESGGTMPRPQRDSQGGGERR